ncbi:MAG: hypothetical protein M1817_003837 [Caeruleum heppii]|nr:MAG: hypothetical protein M1817_003837 [Caeruleum heppii]
MSGSSLSKQAVGTPLAMSAVVTHSPDATDAAEQVVVPSHPTSDRTFFPFFKLPSELRDLVYRALLVFPYELRPTHDSVLSFRASHCRQFPQHEHSEQRTRVGQHDTSVLCCKDKFTGIKSELQEPPSVLAVLGVCRQLSHEALPYFYLYNHFTFKATHEMGSFLKFIGASRRQYITEVSFSFSSPDAIKTFRWLAESKYLKRIHIVLEYKGTSVYHNRHRTLETARGMSALKALRGLESVDLIGYDMLHKDGDDPANDEKIDINHPKAFGPELKRLLMLPKPPEEPQDQVVSLSDMESLSGTEMTIEELAALLE